MRTALRTGGSEVIKRFAKQRSADKEPSLSIIYVYATRFQAPGLADPQSDARPSVDISSLRDRIGGGAASVQPRPRSNGETNVSRGSWL